QRHRRGYRVTGARVSTERECCRATVGGVYRSELDIQRYRCTWGERRRYWRGRVDRVTDRRFVEHGGDASDPERTRGWQRDRPRLAAVPRDRTEIEVGLVRHDRALRAATGLGNAGGAARWRVRDPLKSSGGSTLHLWRARDVPAHAHARSNRLTARAPTHR